MEDRQGGRWRRFGNGEWINEMRDKDVKTLKVNRYIRPCVKYQTSGVNNMVIFCKYIE